MTDQKRIIAICDDMPHVLERTKNALEAEGHTVLTFLAFPPSEIMTVCGDDQTMFHRYREPDQTKFDRVYMNAPQEPMKGWLTSHFEDFDEFIEMVNNPRAALGCDDLPDHVDMVVSDGQMAGLIPESEEEDRAKSGITLAQTMNSPHVNIPVAIYTGAREEEFAEMEKALEATAHHSGVGTLRDSVKLLPKDPEALCSHVTETVRSRTPQSERPDEIDNAQHLGVLEEAPFRTVD